MKSDLSCGRENGVAKQCDDGGNMKLTNKKLRPQLLGFWALAMLLQIQLPCAGAQGNESREEKLVAFDSWVERYQRSSTPSERAQMSSEGVKLVKERRKAFEELIRRDPQRALLTRVPSVARRQLPS